MIVEARLMFVLPPFRLAYSTWLSKSLSGRFFPGAVKSADDSGDEDQPANLASTPRLLRWRNRRASNGPLAGKPADLRYWERLKPDLVPWE